MFNFFCIVQLVQHRWLFIIRVIVYNLYFCCYAKTSSSAVQKRHSKVFNFFCIVQLVQHRWLFIICVIVYNLYYCCYAKTSSSAVQKRHSKVYENPIAPPIQFFLLKLIYKNYISNLRKMFEDCLEVFAVHLYNITCRILLIDIFSRYMTA